MQHLAPLPDGRLDVAILLLNQTIQAVSQLELCLLPQRTPRNSFLERPYFAFSAVSPFTSCRVYATNGTWKVGGSVGCLVSPYRHDVPPEMPNVTHLSVTSPSALSSSWCCCVILFSTVAVLDFHCSFRFATWPQEVRQFVSRQNFTSSFPF